uniref:Aminopeptidase N n=1 Tax=Achaea janata TaxID=378752 RepID=A0A286LPZ6_ACHJA|nr:aminopeptidase N [Achaea janata]
MALAELVVLSLACLSVYGFPSQTDLAPRNTTILRNTIFGDERLEGEIFEHIDDFDHIPLNRNAISAYRLPTTTRPRHYTILWILDFSPAIPRQSGSVAIELYATQANVNEIVIQSDELELSNIVLTDQNNNIIPTTYIEETQYQFLRVQLVGDATLNYNAATPVIYTLSINFEANLRDNMYGIYRSWYRNDPNVDTISWMASTQFQATAGRWAFPCYDEPSFKATFDVTIRRPLSYSSWFCTKLLRTDTPANTNFRDDVYTTTPVMSTYLLALIVAEYTSTDTTGNALHEVIARPNAIQTGQGDYAQEVGQKLLAKMSEHTGYDFYEQNSNLKMTQAAIPDFGAGAMENWGLLTYREAYLLYDENETNSHFKQIIAYILSHEIAHMWFGNLVTCDWWDVLWLNEGFARYYQYFLTYWVEDMGFETRFITDQVHTALLSDSANNPHPLNNVGVDSNSAVSAMFSTISYNKGAAIIRMTEHLLGFEVHETGLRNYLRGMEFQTALPINLFTYLEAAGNAANALNYENFDFIEYYKSWTDQAGHPVLNVNVNHTTGEMTIYQRRFNINYGYSDANNNNYIVPITFATASNPDFDNTKPTHIISKAITVINRGSVGDEWVIFNKQQTGFYRVNYDDYTWDLIALALQSDARETIHEFNRAQIVNDVFQFARSGLMTYRRAFNILSFLEFETDYAPWVAAMTGFSWVRNRLASTTTLTELERVNTLLASWSTAVMQRLTYYPIANEPFMDTYLRLQLAPIMCNIGVQACQEAALTQFNAFLATPSTPVPVDSRNWVYCNGLRQLGTAAFQALWNRFKTHNVYTEKILILQNIGCARDAASLNEFLTDIVTDNYIVRPQDYTSALNSAVSGNEENTAIVFLYIQNNPAAVANAFGSLVTPLNYVAARLRSRADIELYRAWVNNNQALLGNSYQTVLGFAQSAEDSIVWAESIQPDINSYIINGGEPLSTTTAAPEVVVPVVTTQRPTLVEPVTPDLPPLPDSASTAILSVVAVVIAALVNVIV